MGENITLLDALLVSISSMTIVFVVLYVISAILGLFKIIFYKESSINNANPQAKLTNSKDIEEEDRVVLALATAALASNNKSDRHFRITKITRVQ